MTVPPPDSTLVAIRKKIRRLTASAGESTLTTADIDQYINTFYQQDFAYAIKIDQMRSVYTFYTRPNIDRYPIDVNFNQGMRAPIYVDGYQGYFYKDRWEFYNLWPRWPSQFIPAYGDGNKANFSFTIAGPFLSKEVTIGSVAVNGTAISISDDGNGVLYLQIPNPQGSVPEYVATQPGMKNLNDGNPGQNNPLPVGTVNYVNGNIAFTLPPEYIPAASEKITVRVSQYQTGRPYTVLFWNNELTIRPVPKFVHKVEIETYLTPVQFLSSTDNPIINQWWQYIALGAAIKVLEDRQDMEGVENLIPLFNRQASLVLERQSVEEIGQRNTTIFCGTQPNQGWNNGWMQGWY